MWPLEADNDTGEFISQPFLVCFPFEKVCVQQVSAGLNFSILLSSNGLLFSMGNQNGHGELGLGDK